MERRFALRRLRKIAVGTGLIFTICLGVYLIITRGFKIENIEVRNYPAEVIFNREKVTDNLIFFPAEKVRAEILRTNPGLADIQILKKFPRTLVFILVPRSNMARLSSGGSVYMLDRDGVVLGEALGSNSTPLVISESNKRYIVGEQVATTETRSAVSLIAELSDYGLPDMSFIASNSAINGRHESGEILFPIVTDYAQIAATLQSLWVGFRIKGTLPKFIDLRFRQPVVNF